ncbi:7b47a3f9-9fe4-4e3e-b8f1-d79bb70e73c3 [Sclerotinia trifoliorum]|uniref:7b47a3f9-9fe4-4e3e-b8f1-d79bb70e73c3 n=1 Tax=Sclerotinia trifoliorum TaxID=28548 RepID=A0A8H2ZUF0_9HELO|nr:7b47a3f9-9fe4-4e3e-b8f1-d79bb70e73c3 [Sclerotinia trifoliorum]
MPSRTWPYTNDNGQSEEFKPKMTDGVIETDLLIVGAGPAGAALACFLAHHGLRGMVIAATPGTADTPRAHITNMAAMECLRDIGLEKECLQVAVKGDSMLHTRWCRTLAGEEFARIYSWGNDPNRAGDYDAASPCKHVDIPQTVLEPILINRASHSGFNCRFDTTFLSFENDSASNTIISKVQDNLTKQIYHIRSKYLFGCDGARSQVLRQLQIPLIKKPGKGVAVNVLVRAELGHIMENRMGNLHCVMRPDEENPDYGWTGIARMVKPWNEWLFVLLPYPGKNVNASDEEYLECVKDMIGDESISVDLLGVSKWTINETVAEYYSDGNIFCLGDAVHRHPPINGLGSNTCIQDAFNLAWKIAYVLKGKADSDLLNSYSLERQPVGQSVVKRANEGLRDHFPIWEALGMIDPSAEIRRKHFAELQEATPEGVARRARFQAAIETTAHEYHGVGIEMNQRYESSAIFASDEKPRPSLPRDPILEHEITTYPGNRLPHAWLNTKVPGKRFSTIDLAGHGKFSLFTGIGGEKWRNSAMKAAETLGIEISVHSIGWRQDYEDVYFDWARRREVNESGCVLVRPDRFVAWRSMDMIDVPDEKLLLVLKTILSR